MPEQSEETIPDELARDLWDVVDGLAEDAEERKQKYPSNSRGYGEATGMEKAGHRLLEVLESHNVGDNDAP